MKNLKISLKLIILCLSIGFTTAAVIGYFSISNSRKALSKLNFEKMEVLSEFKKQALEVFYHTIITDVETYSRSLEVNQFVYELTEYNKKMKTDASDRFNITSPEYKVLYDKYFENYNQFLKSKGYYDVMLLCKAHGHIMFSVAKESDWGENLMTGELKNSNIAKTWNEAVKKNATIVSDFQHYAPSNNKPAQFIGTPIRNEKQEITAVLVVQVPDSLLNNIMTSQAGLGETGESYLVGSDNLLRSNTRFQKNAILSKETKSDAIVKALNGQKGTELAKDSRGNEVIRSYDKINVEGLNWAILTEIDLRNWL